MYYFFRVGHFSERVENNITFLSSLPLSECRIWGGPASQIYSVTQHKPTMDTLPPNSFFLWSSRFWLLRQNILLAMSFELNISEDGSFVKESNSMLNSILEMTVNKYKTILNSQVAIWSLWELAFMPVTRLHYYIYGVYLM